MEKYYERCVDDILKDKLESCGAVLIKGPKWCGKSTTAEQFANSYVYMQKTSEREQNIALAKNAPEILLSGETPRLIDEWQVIPFIWDEIRYQVDHRKSFGQFILTGSTTPLKKKNDDREGKDILDIQHSGIGRITTLVMRPMTLYESFDSNGVISIKSLFNKEKIKGGKSTKGILDYAFLACRGGWPMSINVNEKVALNIAKNYYDGLVEADIYQVDNVERNVDKVKATLRSYARNISSECSINTIINDVKENDNLSISDVTVNKYINALKKIYVLEDLPAWNPNICSKTSVRTTPVRHFVDPSIACKALGIGPGDLINDIRSFGLIFEDLVIRDLRVYAEKLGGNLYHYRDKNGLEADAVIHLENGEWGAIEVKLRDSTGIEEGAKHLLELASIIDYSKMKRPSFLMIITATDYAYQRKDGVWVVPLACLKD